MSTVIRHVVEMVLRVLGFCRANPTDDVAHTTTAARLEERAQRLQELAAQEQAGRIAAKAAVLTKRETRQVLTDALLFLARIAETVRREEPEVTVRLSLPRPHSSEQVYLTAGRAVLVEAQAQQAFLLRHGMGPDFLTALGTALDQYDEAIRARIAGVSAHVGASQEMEFVSAEIRQLVRLLDTINRRRFRDNAEKAAQWRSARTVVRRARNGEEKPAVTPAPVPPLPGDSPAA